QPELARPRWRPLVGRRQLRGHGVTRDPRQRLSPLTRTHTAPDLPHLPALASRLSLSAGLCGGNGDGPRLLDRIRVLRDRRLRAPGAPEHHLPARAKVAAATVLRARDLPLPLRRQPGIRLLPAGSDDRARARRDAPPLARGLREQLCPEPPLRQHDDRRAAPDADVAVRGADCLRRRVDSQSARVLRSIREDRRRGPARVPPYPQLPPVSALIP